MSNPLLAALLDTHARHAAEARGETPQPEATIAVRGTPMNLDTACPKCGALSAHEPSDVVDIGVGFQSVDPDAWHCPTHGRWWHRDGYGEVCFERPAAPAPVMPLPPRTRGQARRAALLALGASS